MGNHSRRLIILYKVSIKGLLILLIFERLTLWISTLIDRFLLKLWYFFYVVIWWSLWFEITLARWKNFVSICEELFIINFWGIILNMIFFLYKTLNSLYLLGLKIFVQLNVTTWIMFLSIFQIGTRWIYEFRWICI